MGVFELNLKADKAVRLLAKTQSRIAFTLKNDSTEDIYWAFTAAVATSGYHKGIKIASGGDSFMEEHHKGDVWIIAGADCAVSVEDVVKNQDGN